MNTPTPSPETGNRRKTLAAIIVVVFVALLGLLLYGVLQSDRADRESLPSPLIGKPAPEFSLPVLHEPDRMVSAADLRGQPYVLNVWGSWCPACQVEHPVLARFAGTKRVRVIGYNWKDEREDALRWLAKFGNPYWLVLTDYEGRSAIDWGIYGAPETFLVDGNGTIAWKFVGPVTDAVIAEQLLPALERIEREAK
ncbi:DsbE family thiol:disulfide interchange protein [Luteimonas sp. RIT-PG2_3]